MADEFLRDATPWVWLGAAGIMGRIIYHARQVQQGARKPFSTALCWDVPIGLGMGWMTLGLSRYLGLDHEVAVSLGMLLSYLGPYTLDRLIAVWADAKFGKGKNNDAD